jgi:hypothetical protein
MTSGEKSTSQAEPFAPTAAFVPGTIGIAFTNVPGVVPEPLE